MSKFFKKLISIFLVLAFFASPLLAKENIKFTSQINHSFNVSELPEFITVKTIGETKIQEDLIIPENSVIKAQVLEAQKERRWHVSGYILCKLQSYLPEGAKEEIDISEKNIYVAARRYDAINKKDAAILTTELVLTQAASIVGSCFIIFAPVDIAYFFTKGAIQREKDPNWFKAGVSNAYDNSIFWFWLKGKPIDVEENQQLRLKGIKEKKALKLQNKIKDRKEKLAIKNEEKQIKAQLKQNKEEAKMALKKEKINKKRKDKNILISDK